MVSVESGASGIGNSTPFSEAAGRLITLSFGTGKGVDALVWPLAEVAACGLVVGAAEAAAVVGSFDGTNDALSLF